MTWLVTGASSGVGQALAQFLASKGHRVLLVARRRDALEAVSALCPGSVVVPGDLAAASVDELVADVRRVLGSDPLDGVVHAAGVMLWDSPATPDFTLTAQVNAVTPWRLTQALEAELLASPHPRLLFVAGAPLTLRGVVPQLGADAWRGLQRGRGLTLALEAASAKVFMARELHRRWAGRGSAFAFHPGFVKSHLADGLPGPLALLGRLAQPFLASRCTNGEYLLLDDDAPRWSGQLVDNRRSVPGCPVPEDAEAERRLLEQLSPRP